MRVSEDIHSPENWVRAVARGIWRFLLIGGVSAGLLYALWRLKPVVISLIIAAIFAYIMRPVAAWMLQRRGFIAFHNACATLLGRCMLPLRRFSPSAAPEVTLPIRLSHHARRVLATFYVLILLFVVGGYGGKVMVAPFVAEITHVATNWEREYRGRFQQYVRDANRWYETRVSPEWRAWITQQWEKTQEDGGGFRQYLTDWFGNAIQHTGQAIHYVVELVLLPVVAFYFALDSKRLKREFVGTVPTRYRREVLRSMRDFNQIMYSYVVGQAILCALAGIIVGVILVLCGVPYALTLGLLAGVTRAIPIIGPIVGGIPIVVLALVTAGPGVATLVLIAFTIMHFAESKFIMPYLIGDRMELHPVVIIVVLLIGQEFGGLLGMFFAAPIAALIRVLIRRYWLKDSRAKRSKQKKQRAAKVTNGIG
jgi:predicted PurR-regulated permease PerM